MSRPQSTGRYWQDQQRQRQRVRKQGRGAGFSAQGQRTPAGRQRARPARRSPLRRRRRSSRLARVKFGGPATMLWSIGALALSIVALVVQTTLFIALAGLSLAATAVVGRLEARMASSTVPKTPRQAQKRDQNTKARTGDGSGSPKSKPRRKSPNNGKAPARCSDACKRSPRPKSTCRCRAEQCEHGSTAGLGG